MSRPPQDSSSRSTRTAALPLTVRTAVALALASAVGLLAFAWPLLVGTGSALAHGTDAPLVLAVVLLGVLAVLFVAMGDGLIDVKAIAMLGLLSAVGAVLRPLSAGTAGIELVFFVIVLGARVFGPGFGFVLGSVLMLASALLTGGVGPWLPFQMLGASWVGLGAGLLPARLRGGAEIVALALYGALAALAYGLAMNLSFWPFQLGGETALSFVAGAGPLENLRRFLLYSVTTSLGWDLGRALTTAAAVGFLGRGILGALRRAARRASFGTGRGEPAPQERGRRHGAEPVGRTVDTLTEALPPPPQHQI